MERLRVLAVGRHPRRTLARILVLVSGCYLVFGYCLLPIRVEGISMLPTYKNHSINFSNHLAYLWRNPRRGDVVTIRLAGPRVMYLKRIVGLPGEKVAFYRGQLFINDAPVEEPYLKYPSHWTVRPVTLGATEYFVVGDNRTMRPEDHTFGKTDRSRIVGKVIL